MRDFNKYRDMIYRFAQKTKSALVGHKSSMELEDIVNEMALVFCNCDKDYDESRNAKFSTFLFKSLEYKSRNIIRDQAFRRQFEGDMPTLENDEGMEINPVDLIPSNDLTPDDVLQSEQMENEFFKKLSSKAAFVLYNVLYPSDELVSEMNTIAARRLYANERGVRASKDVLDEVAIVARVFFRKRGTIRGIQSEIRELVKAECNHAR